MITALLYTHSDRKDMAAVSPQVGGADSPKQWTTTVPTQTHMNVCICYKCACDAARCGDTEEHVEARTHSTTLTN